jgi:AcrR family transcriptional regulator
MPTDFPNSGMPPGIAAIWGFPPPARRGPKPAHSVTRIVEAAMELADEEGFPGLSLPKIARRLDLTANALYRYVSAKDELLLLVFDVALGPPPADLPGGEAWRTGAGTWTRTMFGRYRERPWLLDIPTRGAPVTPNLLCWVETLLTVFTGSGLPEDEWLSTAILLSGYARESAKLARDLDEGPLIPVQSAEMTGFLYPLLTERGYPILARMLAAQEYADSSPEPDIEYGLHRILDGLAAQIDGYSPERDQR